MPPRTWSGRQIPCRFVNSPGGCRRQDCTFSHDLPANATSAPNQVLCWFANNPGGCRRQDCRFSHDLTRSSGPDIPHGVCKSYWSTGQCNAGDCVLRHMQAPGASALSTSTASPEVAFQSTSNLNMDAFTPAQVNSYLRRFLDDAYRFSKSADVYAFVRLLAIASSQNPSWTSQDGQLLLGKVSEGSGLSRIVDVIVWQPVSTMAGRNSVILSFQEAYIPLLKFLASDIVVKTTLNRQANSLYMALVNNLEQFWTNLNVCMTNVMATKSFKDITGPPHNDSASAMQLFMSLTVILHECLSRFKNISVEKPLVTTVVEALQDWVTTFIAQVKASPIAFDGAFNGIEPSQRDYILEHLQIKLGHLVRIAERESKRALSVKEKPDTRATKGSPNEGLIAHLGVAFEGPGQHCSSGRRHDNDHEDIHDISIAPTHEELLCSLPAYLPANFDGAPHHLPQRTMERHLDVQFRLLREELIAPLRMAIQLVHMDLQDPSGKTKLAEILKKKGGKYRGNLDMQDGVMFNMYTGVVLNSVTTDRRRGITIELYCDAPPGKARNQDPGIREAFWMRMSGKRLMTGGLIALIWNHGSSVTIELGTISSTLEDLKKSAQCSPCRILLRISFFNPEFELRVLKLLHGAPNPGVSHAETILLVESPILYESIRPFLEALLVVPESISFGEHITKPFNREVDRILPPRYARNPGFSYQLDPLFPPSGGIRNLNLDVLDQNSMAQAREALKQSRLDESQASAVVDVLSREVALIQGPPGTGKSYTGVELLRVLLPKAKPILMIAFTNHALDHMLGSILDAGITQNVVRLGGRSSADERVSRFSLEELELKAGRSRLDYSLSRYYRQLRGLEDEIKEFIQKFFDPTITADHILNHIRFAHPGRLDELLNPPPWAQSLGEFELKEMGKGWKTTAKTDVDLSLYGFWREGRDLECLYSEREVQALQIASEQDSAQRPAGNRYSFLCDMESEEDFPSADNANEEFDDRNTAEEALFPTALDYLSGICGLQGLPHIPDGDRPLDLLLDDERVWQMSYRERQKLHQSWIAEIKEREQTLLLEEYSDLRGRHKEIFAQHQEARDEARCQLLLGVDIIGCTTTGAAKLISVLKGLGPRILMVEEAGQVLEAHILGSLVPSVEHLILIGDPLQLRPTLTNYSLSMDSKIGEKLYRFDMSLMERLSSSGFPMSRIDVQRRMRPEISSLIRNTLYPTLIDNDCVQNYPDVRGMAQNIFFLNHQNAENGDEDDIASRHNMYEVEMIKDLVLYLLRQGYSEDGDIVVLCGYLGQLARVRDALSKEVVVLIDDRDMQELASQEEDKQMEMQSQSDISRIRALKQVRIRTVDNYQGEEAKIVILSLVRNIGSQGGHRQTIGFLKSMNRTNVALSRAKEGLYILGNAEQMRSSNSRMWLGIIDQLTDENLIGSALPVACYRHPDKINYINMPGQLRQLAPDGGCLLPCGIRLNCGHICPYKCHPDDPRHVAVKCLRPCTKLCGRGHPCNKDCSAPCGECDFGIQNVQLPCGHTNHVVPCYMLSNLSEVYCNVVVKKKLPHCEHFASMACSAEPSDYECRSACSRILDCCGRDCKSTCSECQMLNTLHEDGITIRIKHQQHPCNKPRYCAHLCPNPCSPNHQCATICKEQCRRECVHTHCRNHCSTPCAPCMEPCTWACPHYECPVPCGSICARLPCDQRCERFLKCNHQCPSVCGEDCSIQICPVCASPNERNRIVDLVLQRSLAEVAEAPSEEGDILITLPKCRHVFTMETLDGHCSIGDWYVRREADGKWIGLQAPTGNELGSHKPPVCPTCRAAITSPRYGRVFKSADLYISERNVIARAALQLDTLYTAIDAISVEAITNRIMKDAQEIDQSKAEPSLLKSAQKDAQQALLSSTRQTPIALIHLMPDNARLYNISSQVATIWKRATTPLMTAYNKILQVANTRSAHINAWEAAYSCIYQQEMDLALMDISRAPRNPREYALRMAKMKVGIPKPQADKQYVVKAFWISIELRFLLLRIVLACLRLTDALSLPERTDLGAFGSFLITSCQDDIQRAYGIAQASNSRRQMTQCVLLELRANLEAFRLDLDLSRMNTIFATVRDSLLERAMEEEASTARRVSDTSQEHRRILRGDAGWIRTNVQEKAMEIKKDWEGIIDSMLKDTYQPLSRDEKSTIVKALRESSINFSHAGHFYECPNGHPYVIDNCGGATQVSQCPECGEAVGGSNHTLVQGNRRAEDLEELLREAGARPSPWDWGR